MSDLPDGKGSNTDIHECQQYGKIAYITEMLIKRVQ